MNEYLKRQGFSESEIKSGHRKASISDLPYQVGVAQKISRKDGYEWEKESLKEENQETESDAEKEHLA